MGRGLSRNADRFDELDVDLDAVAGQLLLVSGVAPVVALVALRGGQPVQAQPLEDAVDDGAGDVDVVVPLQVHLDLHRAEVVVLPQVDDLVNDVGVGGVRAVVRRAGAVAQALDAFLLVAPLLPVEAVAADPVVPAGQRDVPGDLRGVSQDRQASLGLAVLLLLR